LGKTLEKTLGKESGGTIGKTEKNTNEIPLSLL
jgi:hypothetical protein